MNQHIEQLTGFGIKVTPEEDWSLSDSNKLHDSINLFIEILGGGKFFGEYLGNVVIERTDTGKSLGLAYHDRIQLSGTAPLSSWSVIHELAHVWDAKNQWKLSQALEKYTHGFTSPRLSFLKRFIPGQWDADSHGAGKIPGRYGRKPGCNSYGYFFGDQPSGSNWHFNRKEDFAESVVMYCGWGNHNELSKTAHGRIERYLLPNGSKDSLYGIIDDWSDYAKYFYPPNGDYTKTKRWQFVDVLIKNGTNSFLSS